MGSVPATSDWAATPAATRAETWPGWAQNTATGVAAGVGTAAAWAAGEAIMWLADHWAGAGAVVAVAILAGVGWSGVRRRR